MLLEMPSELKIRANTDGINALVVAFPKPQNPYK
jgi:hypothetical protein